MRAELLESHGALERADLTEGSPASPSITAAFGLGDRIPVAGANLTQVLQHLREAIPFPAVCKAHRTKGISEHCGSAVGCKNLVSYKNQK